ncbi:Hypothetical protein SRAE_0000053500 [Strongyloides ratti]|uniref:Uncharacterized protein n=1 Tax=Strongyloides ratti TaxID=34506 RepID=A0A090KVF9_STRRB|nr:Hypothetical protein SRAE_0000053500 [Strongyloides ratti]CEF61411.1 Hypothetical protein SRAE_0000053500 [Strongyloides ratti]
MYPDLYSYVNLSVVTDNMLPVDAKIEITFNNYRMGFIEALIILIVVMWSCGGGIMYTRKRHRSYKKKIEAILRNPFAATLSYPPSKENIEEGELRIEEV